MVDLLKMIEEDDEMEDEDLPPMTDHDGLHQCDQSLHAELALLQLTPGVEGLASEEGGESFINEDDATPILSQFAQADLAAAVAAGEASILDLETVRQMIESQAKSREDEQTSRLAGLQPAAAFAASLLGGQPVKTTRAAKMVSQLAPRSYEELSRKLNEECGGDFTLMLPKNSTMPFEQAALRVSELCEIQGRSYRRPPNQSGQQIKRTFHAFCTGRSSTSKPMYLSHIFDTGDDADLDASLTSTSLRAAAGSSIQRLRMGEDEDSSFCCQFNVQIKVMDKSRRSRAPRLLPLEDATSPAPKDVTSPAPKGVMASARVASPQLEVLESRPGTPAPAQESSATPIQIRSASRPGTPTPSSGIPAGNATVLEAVLSHTCDKDGSKRITAYDDAMLAAALRSSYDAGDGRLDFAVAREKLGGILRPGLSHGQVGSKTSHVLSLLDKESRHSSEGAPLFLQAYAKAANACGHHVHLWRTNAAGARLRQYRKALVRHQGEQTKLVSLQPGRAREPFDEAAFTKEFPHPVDGAPDVIYGVTFCPLYMLDVEFGVWQNVSMLDVGGSRQKACHALFHWGTLDADHHGHGLDSLVVDAESESSWRPLMDLKVHM